MSNAGPGAPEAFWRNTPLGEHLVAAEQAFFDQEVADIFGFNALQLGAGMPDFLRACRIALRARVHAEPGAGLRADPAALPILTGSADLVLLPHVLEFHRDPHEVLREVARVLMPEGHVIISGFNPWSALGLRQRLTREPGLYPWNGQFLSLARLKDWMALLGFELRAGRMCCYVPPLDDALWLQRLDFLEAAGDRWWPFGGGVYFLHGVKRVAGMRLITPRWRPEFAPSKALAAMPQRLAGPGAGGRRRERQSNSNPKPPQPQPNEIA